MPFACLLGDAIVVVGLIVALVLCLVGVVYSVCFKLPRGGCWLLVFCVFIAGSVDLWVWIPDCCIAV